MAETPSGPDAVRVERRGTTAVVTIDRPAVRNAVDGPTAEALFDAFCALDDDADVLAVVLTGAEGTFCAGADLRGMGEGRANRVERMAPGPVDPDAPARVLGPMGPTRLRTRVPVIAAVEGHAVAGGLELAVWCDLRVVAADATFGVFCRRWGVPLIDGGTVRLPRLVGQGRATDMILTGRPVGADEALAWGLADRVVDPGGALDAAVALADSLAAFPQACLRSDRASSLAAWSLPEWDALAQETERGLETIATGETRAGAARFASGAGRGGSFTDLGPT